MQIAFANAVHDFSLFKDSKAARIDESYCILADSGYQGIKNYHKNSMIPTKKPRNKELNELDENYNNALAKKRIVIEHVNVRLKVFKIFSTVYRNRCKNIERRVMLVSEIYNFELTQ